MAIPCYILYRAFSGDRLNSGYRIRTLNCFSGYCMHTPGTCLREEGSQVLAGLSDPRAFIDRFIGILNDPERPFPGPLVRLFSKHIPDHPQSELIQVPGDLVPIVVVLLIFPYEAIVPLFSVLGGAEGPEIVLMQFGQELSLPACNLPVHDPERNCQNLVKERGRCQALVRRVRPFQFALHELGRALYAMIVQRLAQLLQSLVLGQTCEPAYLLALQDRSFSEYGHDLFKYVHGTSMVDLRLAKHSGDQ